MRASTKRHPSDIHLQVGCDDKGLISGFVFDGIFNTGAYASWGPTVANRVPIHACGPYKTVTIVPLVWRFIPMPPAGAFADLGCRNLPLHRMCL